MRCFQQNMRLQFTNYNKRGQHTNQLKADSNAVVCTGGFFITSDKYHPIYNRQILVLQTSTKIFDYKIDELLQKTLTTRSVIQLSNGSFSCQSINSRKYNETDKKSNIRNPNQQFDETLSYLVCRHYENTIRQNNQF